MLYIYMIKRHGNKMIWRKVHVDDSLILSKVKTLRHHELVGWGREETCRWIIRASLSALQNEIDSRASQATLIRKWTCYKYEEECTVSAKQIYIILKRFRVSFDRFCWRVKRQICKQKAVLRSRSVSINVQSRDDSRQMWIFGRNI